MSSSSRSCYSGNPLVNVLCCGLLPKDRLVFGRAGGEGSLAVLLGSSTGRDGIGGVSVLASAAFTDDPEAEAAKRPNVQVGDPFEEKRLIEATLELLDKHLVLGIQDLGGAGITCATSETASRGGVGMDVNVDAVPLREPGLAPFEVMTSESQERMLAIVAPGVLDAVHGGLRALGSPRDRHWQGHRVGAAAGPARVGRGGPGRRPGGEPARRRAHLRPPHAAPCVSGRASPPMTRQGCLAPASSKELVEDLLAMLVDPSWAFRQYDHQLFRNTVVAPGADAAVLRLSAPGVRAPSGAAARGDRASTDGNSRWCALDPRAGTRLVVAESALNVACAGARPVALVNCLNFGNPEHPAVMWQLSEAIDGMAEACEALGIPVVGGNVSLYNESMGTDIDPTPVVGTLGLIDKLGAADPHPLVPRRQPGAPVGPSGPGATSLAGSRWAAERRGHSGGILPPLDLALHPRLLGLVAALVQERLVDGIHDVSDGGLGVALAEMAVKSGTGCRVSGISGHEELFGEGPPGCS